MYNPDIHHRKSMRWQKHDYSSPGAYYVTICIQDHRCLLGNIDAGVMKLNDAGRAVEHEWLQIPTRFPSMQPDEHICMPNHFHGIIHIVDVPGASDTAHAGAATRAAPTGVGRGGVVGAATGAAPTLGEAIGAFKSLTTDQYIIGVSSFGWPRFRGKFWQRDFNDHVIRDQWELEKIRDYIRRNPLMWTCDRYNPESPVLIIDETGHLTPWDKT